MSSDTKAKHIPGGIGELLIIALPMMASSACETVMTFTDRLFLSRLGSAQMNAAMGGGLMCFMMMTFFMGLIGYCAALVAQYFGSGQKKNCAVVVTQALILAVAAYPVILLLSPLVRYWFRVSGIAPEQLGPQMLYFNILIYASIVGLLRNALGGFFSGIGKTRVVMVSSLTAMAVNVAATYVLIFGNCGFPAMGIRGAAYGTIVGGVSGLLIMVAAYFGGREHNDYGVRDSFRFDPDIMKRLFKFGYPAGMEFFLNYTAFSAMVMLFYTCGQDVATAATVTLNWDMVAFVPLIGIEIAVTSLVGRYMGARQPDMAHHAAMSGIKIGSIYSTAMLIMFTMFPASLVNVFRPDTDSMVFAKAMPLTLFMVRTVAVYVLVEAVVIAFTGALRGAGDTLWAMRTSVVLHWVLVGILYVMLKTMRLPAGAAWVAMIVWYMVFSLLFFMRYRAGKWRDIRVIDDVDGSLAATCEGFHRSSDL
ncbi:MAG: MATE family efflux transporter [Armatimonadota bacterium]|nr:MATE family efflux transporter [bacterium]